MAEIVLSTLNAKYIHAAFGLRYLLANLGPLRQRACLAEFDINQRPVDIAEAVLARQPKILGLGVYIWNVAPTTELVAALKQIRPDLIVVLGGPEVSYEFEHQPIVALADYVITGEADLKFAELCRQLLAGERPAAKVIPAELPDFSQLALPYELYDEQDVAHRIIYVEASRGCPFTCEFCLSSLDIPVRQASLPALLDQLARLLERGVRQFKFVDRTFNLNVSVSQAILQFLLEHFKPGHFFHFELVPDRLPEALREIISKFPPGALQFEVGIQTFNEEVGALIKRRQNYARLEENLRFLRQQTGVHVHADLIAGLPGETLDSFAAGFDRLIALAPQEIQVGILKRLRGTPIVHHDREWEMVYNPHPPYEILQNKLLDFVTMQKLRRFARYWDLVGNSGNFVETTRLIWAGPEVLREAERGSIASFPIEPGGAFGKKKACSGFQAASHLEEQEHAFPSPKASRNGSLFWAVMRWSEWLYGRVGRTDGIALARLMELLFQFLTGELGLEPHQVAKVMWRDYQRGGRQDKPSFLKEFLREEGRGTIDSESRSFLPKRQARHVRRET